MDVGDLLRRLLRRRWLVAAVVVLTLVAAGVSWARASSSRRSGAAVVIVPPPLGNAVADQNPLLNLDDNLAELAVVLSAAMNSADATSQLRSRGATAAFTVSTITGDNPSFSRLSPQLVFRVTGHDGPQVTRTTSALVEVARNRLSALQAGADVPQDARAVLVTVVAPTPAEVVGGGRLRSAGSLGLAILVIGLILVLVWDEYRHRRFERTTTQFRRPRGPARRRRRAGLPADLGDGTAAPAFRSR